MAAFDENPDKVGKIVGGLNVAHADELETFLEATQIDIGVVAVPADVTQLVVDRLVACGIVSILNYAPTSPHVPRHVRVRQIDPVLEMQSMTYYLKQTPNSGPLG